LVLWTFRPKHKQHTARRLKEWKEEVRLTGAWRWPPADSFSDVIQGSRYLLNPLLTPEKYSSGDSAGGTPDESLARLENMALNSLFCADVPLSNYSLTLGWMFSHLVSCHKKAQNDCSSFRIRKTHCRVGCYTLLLYIILLLLFVVSTKICLFGLHSFSFASWTAQNWLDCMVRICPQLSSILSTLGCPTESWKR